MKGSAIRAPGQTEKKRCPSDFFSNRSLPQLFRRSLPADPNLRFRRLNRNTGRACARRGDPFSQPSGSSAFWADVLADPHFEPKGADRTSPALLPPARFFWSTILLPHALVLASACVHQLCAHPATGGTRKLSVPGRVHSDAKELWFPGSIAASGVQPVCDSRHGRIACKVSLSCTVLNQ